MKCLRIISIGFMAIGFLFHLPVQWSSLVVHAQEADTSMKSGMHHESKVDPNCFAHCVSKAGQLAQHPDVTIPVVTLFVMIEDNGIEFPQDGHQPLMKNQEPPGQASYILTTQKRE